MITSTLSVYPNERYRVASTVILRDLVTQWVTFLVILDGGLYTTYLYKYIEMVTYEGCMGHIKIKKTNISIFFLSQNVTYKCVVQWVRALIMHIMYS